MARGFTQRPGIDYFDTFAPVVRYDTVRIVLSIVAAKDLLLTQFDVKTAFLHGILEEDIFMDQPPGFEDGSDMVCHLRKGLYGLKQSPRAWNKTFDDFLQKYGLVRCINDPCAYVSKTIDELVILVLYVDDGLITCSSKSKMDSIITHMNHAFEITVAGGNYYVGLEIERDRKSKTIGIHCHHYIQRLLFRFGMEDCKPCKTPGEVGLRLSKEMVPLSHEEKEEMERNPYREAVGSNVCCLYMST